MWTRWIAVLFYAMTLGLVFFHQDMLAMYAMAIGMLSGAILNLFNKPETRP